MAIPTINKQTYTLPGSLRERFRHAIEDWNIQTKTERLWARDASLWTGGDEADWLAWLDITARQMARLNEFDALAAEVRERGYTHAVLLGMGGSSLCPEVLRMTFGKRDGYPELFVLDSTDPAQVRTIESSIDFAHTIFIVSSKSGSTLEPNIFRMYFLERLGATPGVAQPARQFIAITDPGSQMEQIARSEGFLHIFHGIPGIGGRYSALSDFGMVPAAVMGLDVGLFLERAAGMIEACSPGVPIMENPGVVLGNMLGALALEGRDKITFVSSPGLADLGAWLEQLLAESTGKEGKGLIPVDRERTGSPDLYGNDRVFAYLRLDSAPDPSQDKAVDALEAAEQPVIRISLPEPMSLGQEFFRWEIATAVAGSILQINAFNQPDVEASKLATRKLTSEYERTGSMPAEYPIFASDGVELYTDEANATPLREAVGSAPSLSAYLRAHLGRLKAGDYFALLAYVEMNASNERLLQTIRHAVLDAKRVATCMGFGPRYLHSTGQAYKGGPNSGVFLQITCDDAVDLPVLGHSFTFGVVKAAQARGDFEVLLKRRRRALRVHLPAGVESGLALLTAAMHDALS